MRESVKPWERVVNTLLEHFHEPDIKAARADYSAAAAHRLPGAAVWLMDLGASGNGKTERLNALDGLDGVHLIDSVTKNTFLSGQIRHPLDPQTTSSSLLHRIGNDGILIIPDFSTILALPRDHRSAVAADMRRIYDGQLRKEYGTAGSLQERQWTGRITCLVGATPYVDRHYSVLQPLGERFLKGRSSRPGGVETALAAMNQIPHIAQKALRHAVHNLFGQLQTFDPELPAALQLRIAASAELAAHARAHVEREAFKKKEIIDVSEPEAPTRIAQQLSQLAKGSALLEGRAVVGDEDCELAVQITLDCIPPNRRKILDYLIKTYRKATFLPLRMPGSTKYYAEGDLKALRLLTDAGDLSGSTLDLLRKADILGND